MNTTEYNNMVSLLIRVTNSRLLAWTAYENVFSTKVGGCSVQLSSYYDTSVNINEYSLGLFNANGEQFETFSYNESDGGYSQLDELYNAIRDSIYHITESEKVIMDTLEELSKKIPEDNELPF